MIYRKAAIEHLKKRLIETAINNVGVIARCDSIFEDTADNRIGPWLNELPSAQPEIVRCKDCKHRYVEDMIWHCPFGLMGGENFFCGYGSLGTVERRRDG